ncbi:MAG: hypothetical protein DMF26_11765, partial [Verrucomicrobia bacterium]
FILFIRLGITRLFPRLFSVAIPRKGYSVVHIAKGKTLLSTLDFFSSRARAPQLLMLDNADLCTIPGQQPK